MSMTSRLTVGRVPDVVVFVGMVGDELVQGDELGMLGHDENGKVFDVFE